MFTIPFPPIIQHISQVLSRSCLCITPNLLTTLLCLGCPQRCDLPVAAFGEELLAGPSGVPRCGQHSLLVLDGGCHGSIWTLL